MLSEIQEHLAGSSTDSQLVLNLVSTLVDNVMKLELTGKTFPDVARGG